MNKGKKHRTRPITPRLKKRYNLCHRLRKRGVAVNILTHSIELTKAEYDQLAGTAKKHCDELVGDFHFQVQLTIA